MSTCGLLFQWVSTIKIQLTQCIVQNRNHHHLSKWNVTCFRHDMDENLLIIKIYIIFSFLIFLKYLIKRKNWINIILKCGSKFRNTHSHLSVLFVVIFTQLDHTNVSNRINLTISSVKKIIYYPFTLCIIMLIVVSNFVRYWMLKFQWPFLTTYLPTYLSSSLSMDGA
jgi:hypothetical protein